MDPVKGPGPQEATLWREDLPEEVPNVPQTLGLGSHAAEECEEHQAPLSLPKVEWKG